MLEKIDKRTSQNFATEAALHGVKIDLNNGEAPTSISQTEMNDQESSTMEKAFQEAKRRHSMKKRV